MPNAPRFIARLPNPLVIEIVGGDASKVLNNMSTNDVAKLPVDASLETFITDVRGWVVAHGAVVKQAERAWLLGSHAAPDLVAKHIDRYIIRENATVYDRSQTHALIVAGDGPDLDSHLPKFEVANGDLATKNLTVASTTRFEPPEANQLGCQLPIFSQGTLLLCCDLERAHSVIEGLQADGAELCTTEQFDWLRVSSFWPLHPVDISDKTIPQELDRDSFAISFTKGCYLGQETIARLDARGQLQKKLCLVELAANGLYAVGDVLSNGEKEVGHITSLAIKPDARRIRALALLRRGNFSTGTLLTCHGFSCRVLR